MIFNQKVSTDVLSLKHENYSKQVLLDSIVLFSEDNSSRYLLLAVLFYYQRTIGRSRPFELAWIFSEEDSSRYLLLAVLSSEGNSSRSMWLARLAVPSSPINTFVSN